MTLVESTQHPILYRGVDSKGAMAYVRSDKMTARHVHYIIEVNKRIKGISTTFDQSKWLGMYDVIFVLNPATISNRMYEIHGQSTYELTDWMDYAASFPNEKNLKILDVKRSNAKMNSKHSPDEVFIAGNVGQLHTCCSELRYRPSVNQKTLDALIAYGKQFNIPVVPAHEH